LNSKPYKTELKNQIRMQKQEIEKEGNESKKK
jgi:hypothetical protein